MLYLPGEHRQSTGALVVAAGEQPDIIFCRMPIILAVLKGIRKSTYLSGVVCCTTMMDLKINIEGVVPSNPIVRRYR